MQPEEPVVASYGPGKAATLTLPAYERSPLETAETRERSSK